MITSYSMSVRHMKGVSCHLTLNLQRTHRGMFITGVIILSVNCIKVEFEVLGEIIREEVPGLK